MLPLTTREGLAQLIDHPLVKPELTDEQVIEGLELAKRYRIACASVRPCDIDLAVRTLQGSSVKAGAVCGFPHGSQNTATKLYEARDLLRRGAREIDVVVAISKLLSREFQYVQMELLQMSLVIAMAIIGGIESLLGAAVGALVTRIGLELLREINIFGLHIELGSWRYAAFGLLLMFTLRFAQNGLFYPIINRLFPQRGPRALMTKRGDRSGRDAS